MIDFCNLNIRKTELCILPSIVIITLISLFISANSSKKSVGELIFSLIWSTYLTSEMRKVSRIAVIHFEKWNKKRNEKNVCQEKYCFFFMPHFNVSMKTVANKNAIKLLS